MFLVRCPPARRGSEYLTMFPVPMPRHNHRAQPPTPRRGRSVAEEGDSPCGGEHGGNVRAERTGTPVTSGCQRPIPDRTTVESLRWDRSPTALHAYASMRPALTLGNHRLSGTMPSSREAETRAFALLFYCPGFFPITSCSRAGSRPPNPDHTRKRDHRRNPDHRRNLSHALRDFTRATRCDGCAGTLPALTHLRNVGSEMP